MSTAILLIALLVLGLVSEWRLRRHLVSLRRTLAELQQDIIDGTVAIVQEISGSETRLSAAMGVMHDELNASLLRLQDDAVTRISEIQAQPAQVVRVEVPASQPVTIPSAAVQTVTPQPKARREVTLLLMDRDEVEVVHRVSIDPLRRSRTVHYENVKYACVRGPLADGSFIYRRD